MCVCVCERLSRGTRDSGRKPLTQRVRAGTRCGHNEKKRFAPGERRGTRHDRRAAYSSQQQHARLLLIAKHIDAHAHTNVRDSNDQYFLGVDQQQQRQRRPPTAAHCFQLRCARARSVSLSHSHRQHVPLSSPLKSPGICVALNNSLMCLKNN